MSNSIRLFITISIPERDLAFVRGFSLQWQISGVISNDVNDISSFGNFQD